VAVILVGAVIRLLGWRHHSALDADEAITGTMAQALLSNREWPVFYWGQPYGGSLEVGFVAALLALLPDTVLTLRLLPMASSAAIPFVIYAIGRRLYGRSGALVAAIAIWSPVQALAWVQGREMHFYQPTLLLGSIVVLLSLRFYDRPGVLTAGAVGLLSGIGFWMSTNIFYFIVPAGAAMVAAGWRALPRVAVTIPAGLLGATPWLVFNLDNDFQSVRVPPEWSSGSFGDHLGVYLGKGVPMVLGAASPSGWDLVWRRWGILLAFVLAGALLVAALASLARWRPGTPPPVDALGLLVAPVLFSVNPVANTVLIPRYMLMPLAFFALVAGRLAISPKAATVALVAVLGLSGATLAQTFQPTVTRADLGPVQEALAARQVAHFYADYWVTYPLAYQTGSRVVGSAFHTDRRPEWSEEVARAPAPAYVFMCNSPDIGLVESAAQARGLTVDRQLAGGYVVLFVSGPLTPGEVAPGHVLRDGTPEGQRHCAAGPR
jgi:hypothetical protein